MTATTPPAVVVAYEFGVRVATDIVESSASDDYLASHGDDLCASVAMKFGDDHARAFDLGYRVGAGWLHEVAPGLLLDPTTGLTVEFPTPATVTSPGGDR